MLLKLLEDMPPEYSAGFELRAKLLEGIAQ
jgi:hypothetical protein